MLAAATPGSPGALGLAGPAEAASDAGTGTGANGATGAASSIGSTVGAGVAAATWAGAYRAADAVEAVPVAEGVPGAPAGLTLLIAGELVAAVWPPAGATATGGGAVGALIVPVLLGPAIWLAGPDEIMVAGAAAAGVPGDPAVADGEAPAEGGVPAALASAGGIAAVSPPAGAAGWIELAAAEAVAGLTAAAWGPPAPCVEVVPVDVPAPLAGATACGVAAGLPPAAAPDAPEPPAAGLAVAAWGAAVP